MISLLKDESDYLGLKLITRWGKDLDDAQFTPLVKDICLKLKRLNENSNVEETYVIKYNFVTELIQLLGLTIIPDIDYCTDEELIEYLLMFKTHHFWISNSTEHGIGLKEIPRGERGVIKPLDLFLEDIHEFMVRKKKFHP